MKKVLALCLILILAISLTACGKTALKITDIDKASNTFTIVDAGSGEELSYEKLTLNGKEVIDFQCMDMMSQKSVILATDESQIVRDGNTTTYNGKGYTDAAELEYTLEGGVLNIIDPEE